MLVRLDSQRLLVRAARLFSVVTSAYSPGELGQLIAGKRAKPLRLPARRPFAPSELVTFDRCERRYLFVDLWKVAPPPSRSVVQRQCVHKVLKKLLDQPPKQRTPEKMKDLFREGPRKSWSGVRKGLVEVLFETKEDEVRWGAESFRLLGNYFQRAALRDAHFGSKLTRAGSRGPRGFQDPTADESVIGGRVLSAEEAVEGVVLPDATPRPLSLRCKGLGYRVDTLAGGALRVTEYLAGPPPTAPTEADSWALELYALLLSKQAAPAVVAELRQLYLGGAAAVAVDPTLAGGGGTEATLRRAEAKLAPLWARLLARVEGNDPKAFSACGQADCLCQQASFSTVLDEPLPPVYAGAADDDDDDADVVAGAATAGAAGRAAPTSSAAAPAPAPTTLLTPGSLVLANGSGYAITEDYVAVLPLETLETLCGELGLAHDPRPVADAKPVVVNKARATLIESIVQHIARTAPADAAQKAPPADAAQAAQTLQT
ncbi:hypothetical protein M885DRAFT_626108 [Pelagophyceae sp. CCMP2097]|nr:hypothetical protein M885DRAFT_626108 [Pelagophyceae sp. CCMP2097]